MNEFWAIVATDPQGVEFVLGEMTETGPMPLITMNRKNLDAFERSGARHAQNTGLKTTLVKYSKREVVKEFEADAAWVHRKTTTCPICSYQHDAHSSLFGDRKPQPGDATVCANCACFSIFKSDGSLRAPTPAELKNFDESEECRATQKAVRELRDKKNDSAKRVESVDGETR